MVRASSALELIAKGTLIGAREPINFAIVTHNLSLIVLEAVIYFFLQKS